MTLKVCGPGSKRSRARRTIEDCRAPNQPAWLGGRTEACWGALMKNCRMKVILVCASALAASGAQSASDTPLIDRSASARSLPGDTTPSFGVIDEDGNLIAAPSQPSPARRGPEPESDAPGPSLAQAIDAARAAVDSCAVAGYRVG